MTTPFSGIITPQSMSFTTPDGKVHNVTLDHQNFDQIKETIKLLQRALTAGDADEAAEHHEHLNELVDIAKVITDAGDGRVKVLDGVVFYDGEPIHNAVTSRILWGLKEGFDMTAYLNFLDNLMQNPSNRAVEEVYGFIESNNMGIMEDGRILAYKRVRDDFKDIYTGKFDNAPGQIVQMRRNRVDDNKEVTCSHGLHVCAQTYLPHYGAGPGNTIVVVAVWPKDFVSIPVDYANAKARVCEYEVLSEYDGDDKDDLLATKAVWSDDDFNDSYDEDDDDGDDDGWWNLNDDESSDDPADYAECEGCDECDPPAPEPVDLTDALTGNASNRGNLTREEVEAILAEQMPGWRLTPESAAALEAREAASKASETEPMVSDTVEAAVAAAFRLLAEKPKD